MHVKTTGAARGECSAQARCAAWARAFGSENAAYTTALRAAPPQQIRRRARSEAVARGVEDEGVEMVSLPSVRLAGGFL